MSQISGINVELQEVGMVALIGLALIPGLRWTAKATSGPRMALRASLVAGLIVGAIALEASLDNTAESVKKAL